MQLRPEGLTSALQAGMPSVFLLSGDDPLLQQEASDEIRHAARRDGYDERRIFDVNAAFDWQELTAAAQELSLFSRRRLLELRMPDSRPGKDGAAALTAYAAAPPTDTCLLICSGRLDAGQRKARWYKALDAVGMTMTLWPVEQGNLGQWIAQRMHRSGLRATAEACELLAERVEGNLLACVQEIEKLLVLKGEGADIGAEEIIELVADSARYDVFKLVDAALVADPARVARILDGLRQEGVAAALILWALSREIHSLQGMLAEIGQGQSMEQVIGRRRIWPRARQQRTRAALQRLSAGKVWRLLSLAARAEKMVKGRLQGNPWDELLQLSLLLAGMDLFRVTA